MQVVLCPETPGFSFPNFELKLAEEVDEVYVELEEVYKESPESDFEPLLSEVFDVMQTCYSFLRSNFSLSEIESANINHLDKLRKKYAKD